MHWNIFLAKQSSSPLSVVSSSSKLNHLASRAAVIVLMPLAEQELTILANTEHTSQVGYR
jgi:hypothetical protein